MNYLIDPTKITNFNLSHDELELFLLFWICAAGKNAKTSARALNNLLLNNSNRSKKPNPFSIIRQISDLPNEMKSQGIGCYNNKAKSFQFAMNSGMNLKTCSVDDLETIPGVGPKTARCFLIHSRENQKYAGLDTHLLRFLGDLGFPTPKSTPTGKKYKELETIFLNLCDKAKYQVSELDLMIWNAYSKGQPDTVLKLFKR